MAVQREVEFFDRFAAQVGDYDVLGEGAYRRLLSLFFDETKPKPGDAVLDLGCGSGAFTRRLAQAFDLRATGMDISPGLVAEARRRIADDSRGRQHYHVGDITCTGLPDGGFDVIVYSGVLHHFGERAQRVTVLQEGLRLLRPGGRLFAFDPSWHSPAMWLYRDPASPFYSSKGKTENEVLFKRQDLANELAQAGFSDVRIRAVAGTTFRYVESRLARAFLPLYNVYELLLRWSPFEDCWGTFLVSVARKGGEPALAAA